jgi:hypothetical protein
MLHWLPMASPQRLFIDGDRGDVCFLLMRKAITLFVSNGMEMHFPALAAASFITLQLLPASVRW